MTVPEIELELDPKPISAEQPPYRTLEEMLAEIPGENGEACLQILDDHRERFMLAPGSKKKHQAWPGGYMDHVVDAMNIGSGMYDWYCSIGRTPGFSRSDVLLVLFLHDIEKPFKYDIDKDNNIIDRISMDKPARAQFRTDFMVQYGIVLNESRANALKHVEGVRDEVYNQHQRQMQELALLCHQADESSAYLFYNHPLPENDPWSGAQRVNIRAAGVVIKSEML